MGLSWNVTPSPKPVIFNHQHLAQCLSYSRHLINLCYSYFCWWVMLQLTSLCSISIHILGYFHRKLTEFKIRIISRLSIHCCCCLVAQLCLTLCNLMDCSKLIENVFAFHFYFLLLLLTKKISLQWVGMLLSHSIYSFTVFSFNITWYLFWKAIFFFLPRPQMVPLKVF